MKFPAFLAAAAALLAVPAAAGIELSMDPLDNPLVVVMDDSPLLELAHAGGMAGDGCHRDRAAGERHWHVDGTSERGGECVKRDGRTVFLGAAEPAPEPAPAAIAPPGSGTVAVPSELYAELVTERDDLRRALASARQSIDAQGATIRRLESDLYDETRAKNAARRDAHEFRIAADEARDDAAAAEARAVGHGPAVSPRCVRGVHAALDSGWRFNAEEKEALRTACLYERS